MPQSAMPARAFAFDGPVPLVARFDAGRATWRGGAPGRVVLDVDGTDDPAHGQQEGVGYHGYDRQYMYFPLLVFDGETDHLIAAVLRPGRVGGARFVVLVVRRLVARLRAAWPG